MQFSCKTKSFQRGISAVQNVAQSKISNPIVENILLVAEEGKVTFIGTNLAQTLRCTIEASVEQEGEIAIPAKPAGGVARELGGEDIHVSLARGRLQMTCGKSEYKLAGISAEEFPTFLPLSEGQSLTLSSAELREVIAKTVYCTSSEKSRFELDGIKVELSGKDALFIATDGRRLSFVCKGRDEEFAQEVAVLVPTRTWQELGRVLPEGQAVHVTFGESKVMFEAGDVTLLSNLLGDNFPPYQQIIPDAFQHTIVLNKGQAEHAVRRAIVLANEATNQVIMEVNGTEMVVRGESQELGEARDVIEVEYNDEPVKLSYRGDFILDFLRSVSTEKVDLQINDAVGPGGYREHEKEEYLHIIMPMKIQQVEEEVLEEEEQPE